MTREGYFVLAVLLGLRGFAKEKGDPMAKVRESWAMFGERTDRRKVDGLLAQLGHPGALDEALKEPSGGRGRARGRHPRPRSAPARGHGRRARQK